VTCFLTPRTYVAFMDVFVSTRIEFWYF